MEEDTEYKKLPVDERCVHKLWKARLDGYEELIKIFRGIDDEKAVEWNKYLGLVKKFVIDSHAMAQERGLEATLIYVENAGCAGKTVNDVMGGLVAKCFSAPKAKVKDLAFQISLMYIEIEKQDAAVDELVKGLDAKNPKIVAATISVLTQALREFGNKVVGIKPFIKKIPILLADRDKNVRDEAKQLTIEIFRWIGPALKPHIASIAAVLLTELEGEFDKIKNEKAEPTRYLKSQQEKQSALKSAAVGDEEEDANDEDNNQREEIDPMDLIDPVDILSKLPKDFYEKLEAKKWQERKESLEALQKLLENPKLESGDYGDCVKALKKVLTKDTNVGLVAMAGKCLACLAKGLGKKFTPYALACVSGILEKFKEKKVNVVTALREAIDAIYPSTTLEAMQDDLFEALNNKNPSIKAETASFLARAFARTQPAALNEKLIKAYSTALLKTLSGSNSTVRDSSAEALGTLLKLLGEKAVGPYLVDVDASKMAKIKECSEKAVIFVKTAAPKKERPTTAPFKASATVTKAGSAKSKTVTRSASRAVVKRAPAARKPASNNAVQKSASSTEATLPSEREMTPEEVDKKATELLSSEILSGLVDSNWKTRRAAAEKFLRSIDGIESKAGNSQVLVRTLCKKRGLEEKHPFVLSLKLDVLAAITEKLGMTTTTAETFLTEIVALWADSKDIAKADSEGIAGADSENIAKANHIGKANQIAEAYHKGKVNQIARAKKVLTAVAEAIQLEYVVSKVITIAFKQDYDQVTRKTSHSDITDIDEQDSDIGEQNAPKEQSEAFNWVSDAIKDFGINMVDHEKLLDVLEQHVQSSDSILQEAAINLLGTMHSYMRDELEEFANCQKSTVKEQIQVAFDQNSYKPPPKPIRGPNKPSNSSSVDEEDSDGSIDVQEYANNKKIRDNLKEQKDESGTERRNPQGNERGKIVTIDRPDPPMNSGLTIPSPTENSFDKQQYEEQIRKIIESTRDIYPIGDDTKLNELNKKVANVSRQLDIFLQMIRDCKEDISKEDSDSLNFNLSIIKRISEDPIVKDFNAQELQNLEDIMNRIMQILFGNEIDIF